MTLQARGIQMRSRDYHDGDQWFDLEPGTHYFSGEYEIREKPAFEPGWYARAFSSEHYELRYCKLHTPLHFPEDWFRVEDDFLEKHLDIDPDQSDDWA